MQEWLEELRQYIPETQILTDTKNRFNYSFDASFGEYMPEAVVQVKTTEETVHVMKTANRYGTAVTPRGGSTSLSGGPLPVKGGIVLDMAQWPEKIDVDPEDLMAVVTPSVLTADIDKTVEPYGLMYPPDPSSAHLCTIGGNLAENAGGPRGLKYGVTKDYVLGLEVVTPEGDVMKTGGRTIKNVTGFDLTSLIVGSEGTLGVITKAMLKLVPRPPAVQTLMAVFEDVETAGEAVTQTLTSGILPSKIEFVDQACIKAVEQYSPGGLPVEAAAILIIELDGHPEAITMETQQVERIMQEAGASNTRMPETQEEAAEIWQARKLVSPALAALKPAKVSEDATVPRSRIGPMMGRLRTIKEKYQVELAVFGHAGDGNLHPDVLCDKHDAKEMERVEQAVAEIFEAALDLGGTLSGEHGIGTMKKGFMEQELGPVGVDMMKRIKEAWDPQHILNPGKIFPEKGQTGQDLRDRP